MAGDDDDDGGDSGGTPGAGGRRTQVVDLTNGEITVKQKVTQNSADYADKLRELQRFCNFSNTQGISIQNPDDFSPGYPYSYPYTMVTGFEGYRWGNPLREVMDADNDPLQKGDIWYDPDRDKIKYYKGDDRPTDVEIEKQRGKI